MIQAGLTPSTPACTATAMWFKEHFELSGDPAPNGAGVHLEVTDKIMSIYEMYTGDMHAQGEEILSYSRWLKIWSTTFPNVTMRAYKQVTGKCWTCYNISEGRRSNKGKVYQKAYKEAHFLHRCGLYKPERMHYKSRANQAREKSDTHVSWIIDGMDQNHTRLPRAGVNQTWPDAISQHITGVLEHGKGVTLYRNYDNVHKGANLTITVFLAQLELWRNDHDGNFPETIYLQVDGGSENANRYLLGIYHSYLISNNGRRYV